MKKVKILVVGDSCTDEFIYGKCKRLAPEGPVPIFTPTRRVTNRGMAGNVAANLESLGCKVTLITNSEEIVKTRYVEQNANHLIVRVDSGDKVNILSEKISYDGYDAVVISDYDKGFLSYGSIEYIANMAENIPIFMDTKKKLIQEICEDVSFIKINKQEYEDSKDIANKFSDKVIVTLGSAGAMYKETIWSVDVVEIKDISGAGDTFLAGLVVGYLKNLCIEEGVVFANKCASKVVQKVGVSIV